MRIEEPTPPDALLVRRARAGDAASLGLLLHRHRPALYATALTILHHRESAQDAVQDACVVAMCRLDELRDPAACGAWLRAIARNASLMELRRRERERLVRDAPEAAAADEGLDQSALREWVWSAIDTLPETQRLAVVLRYFGRERSYEDVARVCAVPVGTVRSRLNAARAALAEALLAPVSAEHAAAAHADEWESRLAEALDGLNNRDARPISSLFAADATIAARGRVSAISEIIPALLQDSDDGVRVHRRTVVAATGWVVLDGTIENPPDDPHHCPPTFAWIVAHDGRAISRMQVEHPSSAAA